ncbi:hypothetical protein IFR05_002236 [Cadophora sp. M221]|nr:hypothetical protein IFR05_002236 [Cadophora sp. M221]
MSNVLLLLGSLKAIAAYSIDASHDPPPTFCHARLQICYDLSEYLQRVARPTTGGVIATAYCSPNGLWRPEAGK